MYTSRSLKNIKTYVKDVKIGGSMRPTDITVEHRSNNSKRDYLFVNKRQCKHIPASPTDMMWMCKDLSSSIMHGLENQDGIIVVGFAETATAIANFIGSYVKNVECVICTTREKINNSVELLNFSEEHSHATEQTLLTMRGSIAFEEMLRSKKTKYILFVDDEVSTGNTIMNFIDAFEKKYPGKRYGIASICNWMSKENVAKVYAKNIDIFWLIKGELRDEHIKMDVKINQKKTDNVYKSRKSNKECKKLFMSCFESDLYTDGHYSSYILERTAHTPDRIGLKAFENIMFRINNDISNIEDITGKKVESIRVVGTEEFMYLPILIGSRLEKTGHEVLCHSTTRSPIDVMDSKTYGLTDAIISRTEVKSLYDNKRKTFIYNTDEKVDLVIMMSDAPYNGYAEETVKSCYYELFKKNADNILFYFVQ